MKSNAFVTLKGGQDFFLQPVFHLQVTSTKDDRRKVTLQTHFDHKSMLFQVGITFRFFFFKILHKNFFLVFSVYTWFIFTFFDGAAFPKRLV